MPGLVILLNNMRFMGAHT
ncbi:hypothetical protein F383_38102 [Gossypium arboreum]|uniref:Uncharacterized protein n=1 Tax=Gossypium arboreum TaxID=29729 RepID=A0A0B0MF19_GOSAR|nr:hypothetical protein F383_38102 [Gossypium arboreum]